MLGRYALKLWGSAAAASDPAHVLQLPAGRHDPRFDALQRRFAEWHASTVDLPGTYYMQVVQQVFKDNQIAEGRFLALGRVVDLGIVRVPMYLLAAGDDEVVDPEQLFAVTRLTKTPRPASRSKPFRAVIWVLHGRRHHGRRLATHRAVAVA